MSSSAGDHGEQESAVEAGAVAAEGQARRRGRAAAASAAMRRTRLSPAPSTWYRPFCSAWIGSTRAALRAGISAAIMLITTPRASAAGQERGIDQNLAARCCGRRTTGPSVEPVTPVMPRAKASPTAAPTDRSDQAGDGALAEEQRADLRARGAQRAQNADLRAALGDGDGEGIVDDEHPDEEREQAGDAGDRGIDAEQRFELPAAAGGRLDGEAGPERLRSAGLALFERDAVPAGRYRCGRSAGRGRRPSARRRCP